MPGKTVFDTRGESRRPDISPKHRDLWSPFCKFCGDPIDWAEFRLDEGTKALPVTPHTFEDHRPICRKNPFKPRRIFSNPNAAKHISDFHNEENQRLKLKINDLEATAEVTEKRVKELTMRLADADSMGDDVGAKELREAIGTMSQMSVHVRDLAKSVQIILKNGYSAKLTEVVPAVAPAPVPTAVVPAKPPVPPAPAKDPAEDLAAQRRAEIVEQKEKLWARINAGEHVSKAADALGINSGVAMAWADEGRKNGKITLVTIDTVKLEKTKGGRYTGEQKREILRAVMNGLSRPEIHQKFGCTAATLVGIVAEAKKAGLEVKIVRKYVKRPDDVKQRAIAAVKAGKSPNAVAKEMGIPPVTIELWTGRKPQPSKKLLNGHAHAAAR